MSVFKALNIPGLSDIPYVGKLLLNYNPFVYFGVVLCICMGLYINARLRGVRCAP